MDCLDRHASDCEGIVEPRMTNPVRYTGSGDFVRFARCEKHHDAYFDAADARQERQRQAERAERDEWANFE